MKTCFVFVVYSWASQASAQGTYKAASCNLSDISAAITAEQAHSVDGDIISIPAGTCTWTGTTALSARFSNSVTIQGAGAVSSTTGGAGTTGSDTTSITDNITRSGGNPPLIQFSMAAGKTIRITGIAIKSNGSTMASNTGMLSVTGSNTARIDHCHLYVVGGDVGLYIGGSLTGVADHNFFESPYSSLNNMFAIHNGQTWSGDTAGYGDKSWADAEHWGTSQFFFFEDNRFRNGGIGDSHDGARYVLRYNTATSDGADQTVGEAMMYNHGLTSARGRSMRAVEFYANNFVQPGSVGVNHPTIAINGGTILFWGNTVTQYRQAVGIDYTRKNNSTYPYGTTPGGWGNCDGAGTLTAWDGPSGNPCMDAPARGAGDLLIGYPPNVVNSKTGSIAWLTQALSPIYVWNNTFNPAGGYSSGSLVGVSTSMVQDNREYYQQFGANAESGSFNGTAGIGQGTHAQRLTYTTCTAGTGGNKPGVGFWETDTKTLYVCNPTNTWTAYYTPYTYPHPLVAGGTAVTDGSTPNPPMGLTATVQ